MPPTWSSICGKCQILVRQGDREIDVALLAKRRIGGQVVVENS